MLGNRYCNLFIHLSDYPFPLGELEPGKLIKDHKCTDKQKSRMLFGNAIKWLGVKEERFYKNKI
jgi:aminocarboxymuconate-semialdehyde decarboxylase